MRRSRLTLLADFSGWGPKTYTQDSQLPHFPISSGNFLTLCSYLWTMFSSTTYFFFYQVELTSNKTYTHYLIADIVSFMKFGNILSNQICVAYSCLYSASSSAPNDLTNRWLTWDPCAPSMRNICKFLEYTVNFGNYSIADSHHHCPCSGAVPSSIQVSPLARTMQCTYPSYPMPAHLTQKRNWPTCVKGNIYIFNHISNISLPKIINL